MAITVKLYINNSDPKCATKNLASELQVTDTFRMKEPIDILNPVFEIAKSTAEANSGKWQNFNYCIIPNFGNRRYFMNIVTKSSGILECHCKVDALSTYISSLMGTAFEIARTSKSIVSDSLMYADDQRPTYACKYKEYHKLTKLDEATGNNYVLTVAGG